MQFVMVQKIGESGLVHVLRAPALNRHEIDLAQAPPCYPPPVVATILFLGANPASTARLALGEEEREIDQRLLAAPRAPAAGARRSPRAAALPAAPAGRPSARSPPGGSRAPSRPALRPSRSPAPPPRAPGTRPSPPRRRPRPPAARPRDPQAPEEARHHEHQRQQNRPSREARSHPDVRQYTVPTGTGNLSPRPPLHAAPRRNAHGTSRRRGRDPLAP